MSRSITASGAGGGAYAHSPDLPLPLPLKGAVPLSSSGTLEFLPPPLLGVPGQIERPGVAKGLLHLEAGGSWPREF